MSVKTFFENIFLVELTLTGLLQLVAFLGVVYWLFKERATTMVEVICARMQEAYLGLTQYRSLGVQDKALDMTAGNRIYDGRNAKYNGTGNTRRRKINEKTTDRMLRDSNLYEIKEAPSKCNPLTISRPYVGLSCIKCTPTSRDAIVDKTRRLHVVNLLQAGTNNSLKCGVFQRMFCDFGQAYRVRKFNYQQVSETVMRDERLREALEKISIEDYEKENKTKIDSSILITGLKIYKDHEKRARAILYNMRSTISDLLLRITSWTLYKLLPYFLKSIAASPAQVEMLKKADNSGLPLIFIPLHRSHLDYILVSFILLNNDIRCPLVAAGDNLKIPLFGWLLRGLGAFYIKRRIDASNGCKDTVYRAALHTYMIHCLRARHNIEFFIEGGRSRTGKPQLPKGGILSVIVDAYLDGTIDDALLVPVSMNYEKLVDGNFVREQLGMPKQMESFSVAIKSIWKVLNSHYGNIRIDFNQPFSLAELVKSFQQYPNKLSPTAPILRSPSFDVVNKMTNKNDKISIQMLSKERTLTARNSCSSLYGTDVVIEEQRGLIDAIARHVVYDCVQTTAIMSTNAVAFLLLTRFRNGCSLEQLVSSVEVLTKDLIQTHDVGYSGDFLDIVNHAINILGMGLVTKEQDPNGTTIKPVTMLPNVIELSYYSNCLQPHYALQSIVVTALQSLNQEGDGIISKTSLTDASLQLCEIFSQEFILCKPCQVLEDVVSNVIDILEIKGIVKQNGNTVSRSRRFNNDFDDDEVFVDKTHYVIIQTEEAILERLHLQSVLRPLLEVYSMTVQCLPKLLPSDVFNPTNITENEFVQDVLKEMEVLLECGECKFGEALSTDGIKNCLRLLRMWGVMDMVMDGRKRYININRQYNSVSKLGNIYELIGKFNTVMKPPNAVER